MQQTPHDLFLELASKAAELHPELKVWLAMARVQRAASDAMVVESWFRREPIIEEGSDDRALHFLVEGSVLVSQHDDSGTTHPLRRMQPPRSFGAAGFTLGRTRTASVRAMTDATTLAVSRRNFRDIASASPTIAVALLRWAALDLRDALEETREGGDARSIRHNLGRNPDREFDPARSVRRPVTADPDTQAVAVEALGALKCFQGSSLAPLADGIGKAIRLVQVPAGSPIVADGECDGALYILLRGEATVRGSSGAIFGRFWQGGRAPEVLIGESGFLADAPRGGTVTADAPCLLLELPRTSVGWLLAHHSELAVKLHLALVRTFCWRLIEADDERQRLVAALEADEAQFYGG